MFRLKAQRTSPLLTPCLSLCLAVSVDIKQHVYFNMWGALPPNKQKKERKKKWKSMLK